MAPRPISRGWLAREASRSSRTSARSVRSSSWSSLDASVTVAAIASCRSAMSRPSDLSSTCAWSTASQSSPDERRCSPRLDKLKIWITYDKDPPQKIHLDRGPLFFRGVEFEEIGRISANCSRFWCSLRNLILPSILFEDLV